MELYRDGAEWEFRCGDFVRRVRRVADLSQRELAVVSGFSRSLIDRIESERVDPRVGQLNALLGMVNWGLVVVDAQGRLVVPLREFGGDLRDGGGRHYPAHLDLILDPEPGDWWADYMGLQSPPETFTRSRWLRDQRRARSQADLAPYRLGRSRRRSGY